MPTPDRRPGPLIEELIKLTDEGVDPVDVGDIANNGGDLKAKDNLGVFNLRSGSGVTESQHRGLDQLVHPIAENSYTEIERTGSRVDAIRTYTSAAKTLKIREQEFTYTGNQVTTITTKQYDGAGVLVETYTETLSYTGAQVDDITGVLT